MAKPRRSRSSKPRGRRGYRFVKAYVRNGSVVQGYWKLKGRKRKKASRDARDAVQLAFEAGRAEPFEKPSERLALAIEQRQTSDFTLKEIYTMFFSPAKFGISA